MDKLYAGVGAREIYFNAGHTLADIAKVLSKNEFFMRSGGAKKGADRIFELNHDAEKDIITHKVDIPDEAFKIAADHHPAFATMEERTKRLMARNVLIFLGRELDKHVAFAVGWTLGDIEGFGGTPMGMRVCRTFGIPFFNTYEQFGVKELHKFLGRNYAGEYDFRPR